MTFKTNMIILGMCAFVNLFYVSWNAYEIGFWNAYWSQMTDPFCWFLGLIGGVSNFWYHWKNNL